MQVDCEAGYSGCGHPKTIIWHNRCLIIQKIIKEWREPETKHYLVDTDNYGHFKLVLNETTGDWQILEVVSTKPIRSNE